VTYLVFLTYCLTAAYAAPRFRSRRRAPTSRCCGTRARTAD